ncbi:MAG: hypothetical protein AAF376_09360 [Pseudomonadota bacterium]
MKRLVLLTALALGLGAPALAQTNDTPRYVVTFSDRSTSNAELLRERFDADIDSARDRSNDQVMTEMASMPTQGRGIFARIFAESADNN